MAPPLWATFRLCSLYPRAEVKWWLWLLPFQWNAGCMFAGLGRDFTAQLLSSKYPHLTVDSRLVGGTRCFGPAILGASSHTLDSPPACHGWRYLRLALQVLWGKCPAAWALRRLMCAGSCCWQGNRQTRLHSRPSPRLERSKPTTTEAAELHS